MTITEAKNLKVGDILRRVYDGWICEVIKPHKSDSFHGFRLMWQNGITTSWSYESIAHELTNDPDMELPIR